MLLGENRPVDKKSEKVREVPKVSRGRQLQPEIEKNRTQKTEKVTVMCK